MSWFSSFVRSSIGKKLIMSLSGLFLITFLIVHLSVNLTLLISEESFNAASHFMETNPIIQAMQFVLAAGFIIHIVYGIMLTLQNRRARGSVRYAANKVGVTSSISSRSMIISGIIILLFLIIHIRDFFVPMKFSEVANNYELVAAKFANPVFVAIYIISFLLLGLHLSHGFQSAFQSIGASHKKYTPVIKALGQIFFIGTSIGFVLIAVVLYIKSF